MTGEGDFIRFLDVEASGLHDGSYPIEVAWADADLRVRGFLIRPMDHWDERDWSLESERVHNIPRSLLMRDGIPAVEAAHRINEALDGFVSLSDAPGFDGGWLLRLFNDTGVAPRVRIGEYADALGRLARLPDFPAADRLDGLIDTVRLRYPHTHRAGDDALQMAALWRCLADAGWRRSEGLGA